MPVYIALSESGVAKIGFSHNPRGRLSAISKALGEKCRIVREIPGGLPTETWIQHQFRPHRLRGRDWFQFVDEMLTIEPPPGLPNRTHARHVHDALDYRREKLKAADRRRIADIEALCAVAPGTFADLIQPAS